MSVTVYHNPACGTSRKTLALLEGMGHAPRVVEYLKTPPTRSELKAILKAMGVGPRAILREKGAPYAELGLGDPALSDEALIDAMLQHPILINRPIVVTDKGARLCRPPETVLEILPAGAT
ncbi:MAG: arsenate reductase (glutaredoxin) [Hyphomicrobiales bacterium]|nr:MAG: arsenate reductase (glutaredoxin) [Hyphomicrobiales bacterium]